MLFHVSMTVQIPPDLPSENVRALKAEEMARCQELMRSGIWRHIWRVVGEYKNVSIFDAADNATLHDILITLPLYPFMKIAVVPLCRHPSSLRNDDT